ncbi:unnamed protein product [Strongylus vulgaris]|uniref:Uncharacterized protein n=1 Tax=Strongylus vulgaris TaxID=40348 RepID=A0A3P7IN65_STRVU|nr:unnamed protein product [Strongylus vulgaris]
MDVCVIVGKWLSRLGIIQGMTAKGVSPASTWYVNKSKLEPLDIKLLAEMRPGTGNSQWEASDVGATDLDTRDYEGVLLGVGSSTLQREAKRGRQHNNNRPSLIDVNNPTGSRIPT